MGATERTQGTRFGAEASGRPSEAAGFSEARLIEKLRMIEALFAGATTDGEREAADAARERIRQRLDAFVKQDLPKEYRFSFRDVWSRKVFVALLRRYGLEPYRFRGQRYTTVMVKVPERFVDETLWPQFERLNETLHTFLGEVTERVVAKALHADASDAREVAEPPPLPAPAPALESRQGRGT